MHVHAHPHDHSRALASRSRAFAFGMGLNIAFIAAEVIYGVRAHSLALLADAGHNLSDVLGLGLAWTALVLGQQPPSGRHTYGLRRASIFAALANAILLLVAIGGIAWEALMRIGHPQPTAGGVVVVVAGLGVVINGLTALLFVSGRKQDMNIEGAFLHMAADAAVSLGVVVAGFAILRTGWLWLDPVISLAITAVIVWGTWGLLRESWWLAMDAVPRSVDLPAVDAYLRGLPGVTAVHDLHIWGMSTTETALTVHLVKPGAEVDDGLMQRINDELHVRFGIGHATIQLERGEGDCGKARVGAV
jgi:cobalt-zinc-cadmium efflux system protein